MTYYYTSLVELSLSDTSLGISDIWRDAEEIVLKS